MEQRQHLIVVSLRNLNNIKSVLTCNKHGYGEYKHSTVSSSQWTSEYNINFVFAMKTDEMYSCSVSAALLKVWGQSAAKRECDHFNKTELLDGCAVHLMPTSVLV